MAESPLATVAKMIVLWERIKYNMPDEDWPSLTGLDGDVPTQMDHLLADLSISLSDDETGGKSLDAQMMSNAIRVVKAAEELVADYMRDGVDGLKFADLVDALERLDR